MFCKKKEMSALCNHLLECRFSWQSDRTGCIRNDGSYTGFHLSDSAENHDVVRRCFCITEAPTKKEMLKKIFSHPMYHCLRDRGSFNVDRMAAATFLTGNDYFDK